jgi:hypothetical protein
MNLLRFRVKNVYANILICPGFIVVFCDFLGMKPGENKRYFLIKKIKIDNICENLRDTNHVNATF